MKFAKRALHYREGADERKDGVEYFLIRKSVRIMETKQGKLAEAASGSERMLHTSNEGSDCLQKVPSSIRSLPLAVLQEPVHGLGGSGS